MLTTKRTQVLSAALVVTLLVSSAALMLFANAGIPNYNELTVPVELNKDLPGATGFNVFQLSDGSLVLNSANQSGSYLTKLSADDQIVWAHLIHAGGEPLMRMVVLRKGGFLLGGIVGNLYVLAKADQDGNVVWAKTLDSGAPVNYFMDLAEASDGGVVIAGFGEPEMDGLGWIWLTKTDSSGALQWTRTIYGPSNDCPSHLIPTDDGGFVLSDTAYSFLPDQAFYRLIRIDRDGQVLGNSSYGGYGYYYQPECNSAIKTDDGGYLMVGYLWRKAAWVVKTDSDGALLWNHTYGGSRFAITGALETQHGYLLQQYLDGNGSGVILTDKSGGVVWNASWMDVSMPVGMEANFHSLIEAKGGGYVMVASRDNAVWLMKFDYLGEPAVWLWGAAAAVLVVAVAATFLGFKLK